MKKWINENLPIFLNGLFTAYLVFGREWGTLEVFLLIGCAITFEWAKNKKHDN
jgi:hypothetical protein